ncbi:MAG: hypothetical protein ACYTFW_19135, partial [Planctomycetota bacterium]
MRLKIFIFCLLFSISAAVPTACIAAVYYVDPNRGSMNNNGSSEKPWSTVQEVFKKGLIETQAYDNLPYKPGASLKPRNQGAPVKAGDTILLRSGYHGQLWDRGAVNSDYITIAAETGHTPYLKRIYLSAVSKWILRGLTITPELAPTYERNPLIHIESHGWHGPSSDVIIENCTLYSVRDSSKWTAGDWNKLACRGIQFNNCPNSIIRNNTLKNINFGIVDFFGD